MLSSLLGSGEDLLKTVANGVDHIPLLSRVILVASFFLLCAWIAWSVYRFRMRPVLYPDEVPELPYWIPCGCSFLSCFGGIEDYYHL